eukprot:1150971-Pelagomonas_calceolata.AAC.2
MRDNGCRPTPLWGVLQSKQICAAYDHGDKARPKRAFADTFILNSVATANSAANWQYCGTQPHI